jgi:hypothetical protein
MLSAELAALGAVAALVGRTGLLATGSLVAAIDSLDLKDATALRRAMYSVDTLAASDTDAH